MINEFVLVFAKHNGKFTLVPFCELAIGDYVPIIDRTIAVEPHLSTFDDWLLYDDTDMCWFPEELEWNDEDLDELWAEFGDVPMNPETECIESYWLHFPAGTHREEIWHWFEETFDCRVADLMYGVRESKRTEATPTTNDSHVSKMKELAIKRELNDDTRKQGLFIDGVVYSLHITNHDEAIITDNTDYSRIYAIHSLDFYNLLTR